MSFVGKQWLVDLVDRVPRPRIVVRSVGLEEAVQDAYQAAGELAERGVVADAAGVYLVVLGAGAG